MTTTSLAIPLSRLFDSTEDGWDYNDWGYAFEYAASPTAVITERGATNPDGFTRDDVAEIIALWDGDNDGPSWVGVFRLKDGRFAFLTAWCDYTGWGCQEDGCSYVASNLTDLVRFGIGSALVEEGNYAFGQAGFRSWVEDQS